jgi:hypothetical protein
MSTNDGSNFKTVDSLINTIISTNQAASTYISAYHKSPDNAAKQQTFDATIQATFLSTNRRTIYATNKRSNHASE